MCGLASIVMSSYRYCSRRSDEGLKERLVPLARGKPRRGYRRLQVLMEREGERVNHKRQYWVYREARSVPDAEKAQAPHPRRIAACATDGGQP